MSLPDDQLPERLAKEMHGLIPDLPGELEAREVRMLGEVRAQLRRSSRAAWWVVAGAMAAACVIGVSVWQAYLPAERVTVVAQAGHPTIIDVLKAAKRGDTSQAKVDQLALMAVRIEKGSVQ